MNGLFTTLCGTRMRGTYALPPDEVHVWRASLVQADSHFASLMRISCPPRSASGPTGFISRWIVSAAYWRAACHGYCSVVAWATPGASAIPIQ